MVGRDAAESTTVMDGMLKPKPEQVRCSTT